MVNELKIKDSVLKTPRDILNLEGNDLYDLLKSANEEVIKVEEGIARAEDELAKSDYYEKIGKIKDFSIYNKLSKEEKMKAGKFSQMGFYLMLSIALVPPLMIHFEESSSAFFISIFVGMIIFTIGIIKYANDFESFKKNLLKKAADYYEEANRIYAETQRIIDNVKFAIFIPNDYRYSLALGTMLKFLSNGRANNWTELADKYEEATHRWQMEKDSKENLEIQRYNSLKLDAMDRKLGRIQTNTTISAVIDVAGFLGL
jgi:hypothetical protein